ncbi:MAG: hypothetical protein LBB36_02435 [Fibromonadaceae bacterium]|jgi:hypothetical protein|nr:hypothetical protein [Fibromonadaceae bacterium]
MQFLSVREFNSFPRKTMETLKAHKRLVLTSNGKPSMLVLDIAGQDFETVLDTMNRAEAMKLFEDIQMQASRANLDGMSLDEINSEIKGYRKSKVKYPHF